MQDNPPFIATQRLFLLDGDVSDPWQFLRPESFRAARLRAAPTDKQQNEDPHTKYWNPITPEALFCDGGTRRLCITTDAGVGKSTWLQWAEQELNVRGNGQLAVYLEMRDLPKSAPAYMR